MEVFIKKKVNITISDETIDQLDWLKTAYMNCGIHLPLSELIAIVVSIAYFDRLKEK